MSKRVDLKSLGIDGETHRQIKVSAAMQRIEMWEMIARAWQSYSSSIAAPTPSDLTGPEQLAVTGLVRLLRMQDPDGKLLLKGFASFIDLLRELGAKQEKQTT